jgi:hypothetical protein
VGLRSSLAVDAVRAQIPKVSAPYLPSDLQRSALVVIWAPNRDKRLIVRNLGPGRASIHSIEISLGETPTSIQHAMEVSVVPDEGTLVVGVNLNCDPQLPIDIEPGLARELDLSGPGADVLHAWSSVQAGWVDEAGLEQRASFPRGAT